MYVLATLANKNALHDLKVFLFTVQLWNTNLPKIYIICDTFIENYLIKENPYNGELFIKNTLDKYNNYDRKQMESLPGKEYKTLFGDFVIEKTHLLDWVLENETSVLFCDADICFMASLPDEPEEELGVSRHNIRTIDEEKFGIYNAGFLYTSNKEVPSLWREFSKTSKFFEQVAIEDLVKKFKTYEFSDQNNYGWWRLLQGKESVQISKSKWSIKRFTNSSGICVEGKPLLSIHTHWKTNDMATILFNDFVKNYLEKLKSVDKTKKLFNSLCVKQ